MKKEPLVSIILPTYKRTTQLKNAIQSVLKQTYKNIEIIVIDDNHPESEYRKKAEIIMEEFSSKKIIKYIKNKKNLGAPAARNTGIEKSRGEYISFLDDDDLYDSKKIEMQINKYKENNYDKLGIVYCKTVYKDENDSTLRYSAPPVTGDALKYHLKRNLSITSAMLIKRSCIEDVGGFENMICGQEYELILRILANGYKVDYVDEELLTVYLHENERISTSRDIIKGKKAIYELKKKYFVLLTNKEIRDINHSHYLSLYREYIALNERKEALRCYIEALKNKIISFENIIEISAFILPYKIIISFKRLLHIANNKIKIKK